MSVIGFDFGNENCFIAVARSGGIETIANEYSQRVTPSYVAFGQKQRDLGVSAKNKQNTNIKSTVYGFKRYIGKHFNDTQMHFEKQLLPYSIVELPGGEVGVTVQYLHNETTFTSRQITGMLFTKLKQIAEATLKIKVIDCVVSVPYFFNDLERRALLDATRIAGLNCLKLMNETTAVALSYGFYKNELPEDKPRLVAFIDMGHSALQVSVVAFNKERLKMLSCESDIVGGRDFDRALVEYFCDDFQARYKLDVRSNKRALIRLYTEAEKLKKQMSSIALELPINIECFMEDQDVSGKMKRDQFEELVAPLLARIHDTILRAIDKCPEIEENMKITVDDIESIEIVGGSSRVPAVKAIVRNIFKREPSTTLNADEAVSRGCALQCAMLSPNFKVKEFSITDLQPYPIAVRILPKIDPDEQSEYDVFPAQHQVPFSRVLSVFRRQTFQMEAFYRDNVPFPEKNIGKFQINVMPKNSEATPDDKVKVKVRVNLHGIFTIVSGTFYEASDEKEEIKDGEQASSNGDANVDEKKKGPKMKQLECRIDFVSSNGPEPTPEILKLSEKENQMVTADLTEQRRLDAKNAVEEYVYEMRDKLSDVYSDFASENDKAILSKELTETEDWLYGDGEEVATVEYETRLQKLHSLGQPIHERFREFEDRPRALECLGATLQKVRKALASYQSAEPQYSHLAQDDINKLAAQLETKQSFLDECIGKLNNASKSLPPPIFVEQIREETESFERVSNQILSKPKPNPPSPPKEEPMETKSDAAEEPMETKDDDASNRENGMEVE